MASPRTKTTARGTAALAFDKLLTEIDPSSDTFMMPPVGVRQLSIGQSVTGGGEAQRRPDEPEGSRPLRAPEPCDLQLSHFELARKRPGFARTTWPAEPAIPGVAQLTFAPI